MHVSFDELNQQFNRVLLKIGFSEDRAAVCARIFAENSLDGVYSHGVNRFPAFIKLVKEGKINIHASPEVIDENGVIENWDGHLAPGMYTAQLAINRAIALAKENAMGCVALKNTNHWMRGGTYGWQAAEAGCIGICFTNTIANMPPWGGTEPRLGNNPLVIAIPRKEGHMVLDMAMSQFSYGKLQEYELKGKELPIAGGYTQEGVLTTSPEKIYQSKRILPIGYWKGSALSFMLDVLVTTLSKGRSVAKITADKVEYGLSQVFICIEAAAIAADIIEEIITYTKSSLPIDKEGSIRYPGENTLITRKRNEKEGIPVNDEIWQQLLDL